MKMTSFKLTIAFAVLAFITPMVQADSNVKAGPKGGRMLNTTPAAEFFVEKDHTVSLTLYSKEMKPVPVGNEVVTLIADKDGKKKIEMEKKGDLLVSKSPLPKGDGYTVIVQFKTAPDAKPKNFRIPLDMSTCGGCDRAEYACDCDE